jgi:hypothetical protein
MQDGHDLHSHKCMKAMGALHLWLSHKRLTGMYHNLMHCIQSASGLDVCGMRTLNFHVKPLAANA